MLIDEPAAGAAVGSGGIQCVRAGATDGALEVVVARRAEVTAAG
jgi:hypothetical protein